MPRCDDILNNLNNSPILCHNLGIGEQGTILSELEKAIVICPSVNYAKNLSLQLKALNKPYICLVDFDKPYTLTTFKSQEYKLQLINALFLLTTNSPIVLTTAKFLHVFLPNLNSFKNSLINLYKNEEYEIVDIEKKLINLGYKKVDSVTERGEFAIRGDILDVFNIVDNNPTRLDFFDTVLTDIVTFDFLTFEKLKHINSFNIAPNKLMLLTENEKENIIKTLNKIKLEEEIVYNLISSLENNEDLPLEFIAPFCNLENFKNLNYPKIIINELQFEATFNKSVENYLNSISSVFKSKNLIETYKNSIIYSNISKFYNAFNKNLIFFDNLSLQNDLTIKLKTKPITINYNAVEFDSFLLNINKLLPSIKPFLNKKIFLCLSSVGTLNSIKTILEKLKIPHTLNKNGKGIILTELDIPYNICFKDSETFYIGSTNFAHKKVATETNKKTIKYLPKAGEYVVHAVHGVGKCEGVVNMKVEGADKEFFRLTYKGGNLYVPCENAECLSLYMADGENISLNKLGGKEFETLKNKASRAIEDMSKELLELYAKRKSSVGFKYLEDDYIYTEFEAAFPYTETPDQLQAISAVKRDMVSGKVMDRLICGDVGFGKTEVAMRAMFKAVQSGKQVAILAPTTILSLQHFNTVVKRTANFGLRIEMLNRFKTKKEQEQIINKLKLHQIDVICGTHRLISEDVEFADLGLLVLDEEQRFGVKAKEKIKDLKHNVDVLTLSATPIPRTLSMSLMNIRDISIINTPPVNRLPIKTYVTEFNLNIIADAINYELNRDGQVLIVYNDIEKIYAIKQTIMEAVNNPNAVFDVTHGRMSEQMLEKAIEKLYNGETNVLISTTLIENGVDLARANTLIVIDSDKLGLSQMYQLRGRVGRSNEQAFAYFTYPKNKVLTEEATNRLQALAENTELGSGFKIAMRDLQIRGAGELLGKVQHGHMVKIGYEMYTKLLNDTINRLQGKIVETERDVKIDIALSSIIPHSFVQEESERLQIIAKITEIQTSTDAKKLLNEFILQYGKLPKEIYQLCNIAVIRYLAQKQKVKNITLNNKLMQVVFYDDVDLQTLIKKVQKFSQFKFLNSVYPTITLDSTKMSVVGAQNLVLELLSLN